MNYPRQHGLGLPKGDGSVCVLRQPACVTGTGEGEGQGMRERTGEGEGQGMGERRGCRGGAGA